MANHKSSKKRARQTIHRTARNKPIKSRVQSRIRAFRESLLQEDANIIQNTLKEAEREIRKACSKGIFHKRNASRKISRLARMLKPAN